MAELSIRIKIAEREYPMRVNEEEEERLRIAGRMLNERLRTLREEFGIDDKQDLLAMIAFDMLAEKLKEEETKDLTRQTVGEKLDALDNLLSTL
jgi:cell division protein ZapA